MANGRSSSGCPSPRGGSSRTSLAQLPRLAAHTRPCPTALGRTQCRCCTARAAPGPQQALPTRSSRQHGAAAAAPARPLPYPRTSLRSRAVRSTHTAARQAGLRGAPTFPAPSSVGRRSAISAGCTCARPHRRWVGFAWNMENTLINTVHSVDHLESLHFSEYHR